MHFVDRERAVERVVRCLFAHPRFVAPLEVERYQSRRCAGSDLRPESERVGLVQLLAVSRVDDPVLVTRADRHMLECTLKDARAVSARAQRRPLWVPIVEVSDDRNRHRVRRPYPELHAIHMHDWMCPESLVKPRMRSFAEPIEVEVGEAANFGARGCTGRWRRCRSHLGVLSRGWCHAFQHL